MKWWIVPLAVAAGALGALGVAAQLQERSEARKPLAVTGSRTAQSKPTDAGRPTDQQAASDEDCCGAESEDPSVRPDRRFANTPAETGPAAAATVPTPGEHEQDAEGEEDDEPTIQDMAKQIAAALGKQGELKDEVYTVTFPRTDLDVSIEGMEVPAAAGVASEFRFYRCPCGKAVLIGQFVVADYEANDVVDSLLKGRLAVASVGPLLLYERPRLMLIRFQGEGKGEKMAKVVREALTWTGEERMAPVKLEPEPSSEE